MTTPVGVGALTYIQYRGCVSMKGVILTKKNMQEKGMFFTKMQEKGVFLDINVLRCVPLAISCFFAKKIARERVSFSKSLQEKGYGFGDLIDTPTRIRQVLPPPRMTTL